jgi:hypothetical protein
MGGGGGTTVNQTGIGDAQYDTLVKNQGNIQSQVSSGFRRGEDMLDNVDYNVSRVGAQVSGVGNQVSNLDNRVSTGFSNVGNQISGTNNLLNNLSGTTTAGFAGVGNQLNQLNTQVDRGFTGVNQGMQTGFNALGEMTTKGFDTVGNQVETGFGRVNQNVTDARDAIQTGMATNQAATNARFDQQGNQIATGFTDARDQLETVQGNVLGGQGQIRGLVEQYGNNLDRYYANLASGQSDAASRLGGLQTGLDDFRAGYNRDALVASQQRAKMSDSIAGGFNAVRDDFGRGLNTIGEQNRAMAADVQAGNQSLAQATQQFSDIARKISLGAAGNNQQDFDMRNEFVSRLNAIKQLASDPNVAVPDEVRADYVDLASSFDDAGRLIARGVGPDGLTTARALDNRGDLLLAKFDNIGNRVDQKALNVDNMMQQLDNFGVRASSTGLASPFITT